MSRTTLSPSINRDNQNVAVGVPDHIGCDTADQRSPKAIPLVGAEHDQIAVHLACRLENGPRRRALYRRDRLGAGWKLELLEELVELLARGPTLRAYIFGNIRRWFESTFHVALGGRVEGVHH